MRKIQVNLAITVGDGPAQQPRVRVSRDKTLQVSAYGHTRSELEVEALRHGRDFFGPSSRVAIVGGWGALPTGTEGRFRASITVQEVH